VHGIQVPGPGSYGRYDAGSAGIDATSPSKHVLYQHGRDPKGPASIHRVRAALDKDGALVGYVFESKGFSRVDIDTNKSNLIYSLASQLMGLLLKSLQGPGVPAESFGSTNKPITRGKIAPLLDRASPLRTAHLRDPVGLQILASAAKQSQSRLLRRLRLLATRLPPRNLKEPRATSPSSRLRPSAPGRTRVPRRTPTAAVAP
jgi:hypothetical protein